MEKQHGIRETKEMVTALMELSVCLIDVFKDGIQITDAMELWEKIGQDPVMKKKFAAALDGYRSIPAEIKDLDAAEGVELATCLLMYIPKILDSLRK